MKCEEAQGLITALADNELPSSSGTPVTIGGFGGGEVLPFFVPGAKELTPG